MQRTEGVRDTGVKRKDRDLKRKCARARENVQNDRKKNVLLDSYLSKHPNKHREKKKAFQTNILSSSISFHRLFLMEFLVPVAVKRSAGALSP